MICIYLLHAFLSLFSYSLIMKAFAGNFEEVYYFESHKTTSYNPSDKGLLGKSECNI